MHEFKINCRKLDGLASLKNLVDMRWKLQGNSLGNSIGVEAEIGDVKLILTESIVVDEMGLRRNG